MITFQKCAVRVTVGFDVDVGVPDVIAGGDPPDDERKGAGLEPHAAVEEKDMVAGRGFEAGLPCGEPSAVPLRKHL